MSPRIIALPRSANLAESFSVKTGIPLILQRAVLQVLTAAGTTALLSGGAEASPTGTSIPIKFAAEQTNGAGGFSSVDGAAGVLSSVNWNNTSDQSGALTLNLDRNGAVVASSAMVNWSAAVGNWSSSGRGEENNFATGENRDLMAGYLDTSNVSNITVTVSGLSFPSSPFNQGYDVYVYVQGGINGRGGTYNLGASTLFHGVTTPFDGTFIEDNTVDTTTGPEGSFGSNYILFRNVTGDSFTLTT